MQEESNDIANNERLGYLLPENPLDHNTNLICTQCKASVKAVNVAAMSKGLEDSIEEISNNLELTSDEIERELRRFSLVLHPKHYLMLRLKKRLIDALELEDEPKEDCLLRCVAAKCGLYDIKIWT